MTFCLGVVRSFDPPHIREEHKFCNGCDFPLIVQFFPPSGERIIRHLLTHGANQVHRQFPSRLRLVHAASRDTSMFLFGACLFSRWHLQTLLGSPRYPFPNTPKFPHKATQALIGSSITFGFSTTATATFDCASLNDKRNVSRIVGSMWSLLVVMY